MAGEQEKNRPGAAGRVDPPVVCRRAERPLRNLEAICEEHLAGRYRIEVIDLLKQPQLARGDQIIAVPTLVRHLPPPMKKIIGDLSNEESVLVGLDLRARRRKVRGTA